MTGLYHVYVIQSNQTKELYFGFTGDIEQRVKEHNEGKNTSTAEQRPWTLVYCESYRSERDARNREQKLKHYGNARTYVKRRLTNGLL
ncbi:GIY-YIG nuclease family protein [Candidatus Wolfebacteria bacterium]|nr:GIY-YIG nuclease family protein [Candidatus Wolfebacteria bacterium]